jgi:hypothetical protein
VLVRHRDTVQSVTFLPVCRRKQLLASLLCSYETSAVMPDYTASRPKWAQAYHPQLWSSGACWPPQQRSQPRLGAALKKRGDTGCKLIRYERGFLLPVVQPLWSSGHSSWLLTLRSRVLFPALPDFLSSSGSGTGSTQPL